MKNILTYGTYDLFHIGHVKLFKRLKAMGDNLIVGVSTDHFNKLKDKHSIFSYEERAGIVKACRYVDLVIPENNWEQKKNDIEKYNITTFAMGDDWQGRFDHLKAQCEVIYLPRTENISSTDVKQNILSISQLELDSLKIKIDESIRIIESLQDSLK
ncbi:glycerol-3-phosphate cytidylyltransferase [Psychromonas sp. RZ22]|uniref:glycerol-3-phosphate cytidylyltransferase n=1 Tax=Psychromonas algarum TaxID=2555643 RepID=UPI0010675663|nr:glycerol-3-phosphate cytidylyltransferase [Psychromonas sp. RZ22]TEW56615.1 glycerol-3-phosphate cytidylyltransferase [Psychromonas sp. RZ22]